MGGTTRVKDAFQPIETEMERTVRMMIETGPAESGAPAARGDVTENFLGVRGKGLRPGLVLLSAKAFGRTGTKMPDAAIRVAAAVELIHGASLIHDDMVDGSMERRRRPALHVRFGRRTAILAGDLLFSRAFSLLSTPGLDPVPGLLAACVEGMCRGELDELSRPAATCAEYERMIEAKTASFMAVCCRAGALTAGACPESAMTLHCFGRHFGMAYQLLDDYRDGDVLLDEDPDFVREALRHIDQALQTLLGLPDSEGRRGLERLAGALMPEPIRPLPEMEPSRP